MLDVVDISSIQIILAGIMLWIALFSDLKYREISDLIWIIFGIIAVALIFVQPEWQEIVISTLISLIIAPVVLMLWRIGLFGGADAFAFIILAILIPQTLFHENSITPFTVLTNTVLLSSIAIFVNISRNLISIIQHKNIFDGFDESFKRKIIAMMIGYKADSPKFAFSMERISNNKKQLVFSLNNAEETEFCNTPNTWVTPAIPYMLYVFGGFLLSVFYGDIIVNIFNLF